MIMYNFDEITDRRGTGCVKWDETPVPDVIPLWVADMDFKAAPAIQEAIRQRAEHGVFGYTLVEEPYYEAIISWFQRRHNWTIRREEILYTTGVVPAMSVAIKALTMPGEKVLILSPDYNCFFSSIRNNGCEVLESVLRFTRNNHFEVDWQDFEAKCADEKTTVFLLCNPHNPTGRVWTKEELEQMNAICLKHGVKVVSDEIHCELIMPGHTFQPFAAVSEACRENSVVLNSPSKSFNIAGLQIANIICARVDWRRRLDRAININEVCDVNPFGPVALMAAYNESEDWVDELNLYLWDNYKTLCDFAAKHLPQWKIMPLEGTYLPWVDITATGMTSQQYANQVMQDAKVWVNPGTMYGPQSGEGYIRLNIACPRSVLMEALERIKG
ncbi:MalY/PatB family protein [Prevotella sp. E2-28]|uniref:MalY/PatB family protein n=1 Tax=Prevotella sp. E2-28 TaxID=2913620 RepID=UPI001EDA64A3|nr:MalY/PatB family protein [Prevotella sp. E2-28]UKK55051.1 pyridoxal phosphate-dependent aminotransferase [Prevotella sp. E2-28]